MSLGDDIDGTLAREEDSDENDLLRLASSGGRSDLLLFDWFGRCERGWETLVPHDAEDLSDEPSTSEVWYGVPRPDAFPSAMRNETLHSVFLRDSDNGRCGVKPGLCEPWVNRLSSSPLNESTTPLASASMASISVWILCDDFDSSSWKRSTARRERECFDLRQRVVNDDGGLASRTL